MASFHIDEVMLVDDDAIVRMVATKILKTIEFTGRVLALENGLLAIEEIRRRSYGAKSDAIESRVLLLLDINMPELDAWGFLDEFSKLDQEIKNHFSIAIITSSIDTNDRIRAYSYPDVLDYISKPLSCKHLLDFMAKHKLFEESSSDTPR